MSVPNSLPDIDSDEEDLLKELEGYHEVDLVDLEQLKPGADLKYIYKKTGSLRKGGMLFANHYPTHFILTGWKRKWSITIDDFYFYTREYSMNLDKKSELFDLWSQGRIIITDSKYQTNNIIRKFKS